MNLRVSDGEKRRSSMWDRMKKYICAVVTASCVVSCFSATAYAENTTVLEMGATTNPNQIKEFQVEKNGNYDQQVYQYNQDIRKQADAETTQELLQLCRVWLSAEDYIQLNFDQYNAYIGKMDLEMDKESYAAERENILSNQDEIKKKALEVTQNCTTDYEKCKAIHDWVSRNVWYDMDVYDSGKYKPQDAISVLKNKKGVCEGYANLTVEMLRSINIPAKKVRGISLGLGMSRNWTYDVLQTPKSNHAWTEAYVDGKWIILDTTWDSQNVYENGEFGAQKPIRDTYFDPSLETFSKDHLILRYDIPKDRFITENEKTIPWSKETQAWPVTFPIVVNGKQMPVNIKQVYFVEGNTTYYQQRAFYKLRDLEQALMGTEKQIEVKWDGKQKAINIVTGAAANPKEGVVSMETAYQAYNAVRSDVPVYVNGKKTDMTVYSINGSNYVRLRDFGEALNLYVGMDLLNFTFVMDTKRDYVAAPDYYFFSD